VAFAGGKPGNFPLTGSGNGKGEGRKREGWERPPALLPPTGFCLKYHPG